MNKKTKCWLFLLFTVHPESNHCASSRWIKFIFTSKFFANVLKKMKNTNIKCLHPMLDKSKSACEGSTWAKFLGWAKWKQRRALWELQFENVKALLRFYQENMLKPQTRISRLVHSILFWLNTSAVVSSPVRPQRAWPSINAVMLTSLWDGGRAGGSWEKPATWLWNTTGLRRSSSSWFSSAVALW